MHRHNPRHEEFEAEHDRSLWPSRGAQTSANTIISCDLCEEQFRRCEWEGTPSSPSSLPMDPGVLSPGPALGEAPGSP